MKKPLYQNPFLQVVCAIVAGIALGIFHPPLAIQMKPLGDVFIAVVRLIVIPVIFFTVASGIAAIGSLRELGRLGVRMTLCFEALAVLSLGAGLLGGAWLRPGEGFGAAARSGDPAPLVAKGQAIAQGGFLQTLAHAVTGSAVLQALLLAMLCGVLLLVSGRRGEVAAGWCRDIARRLFVAVKFLLKAAPLAAFGAIAFTIGKYGLTAAGPLAKLLGALYLVSFLFVLVVLGAIARVAGFSILRFVGYAKEELAIVIGTSSSVAAMPALIARLERAGCPEKLASLIIAAGYSFNLCGSNIYITLALVFLAQACGLDLTLAQYGVIFAVAMVTSKGATGVAGSSFVVLAATLAAVPELPAESLLLIVGIERLLKCRPMTNIIGNGVACVVLCAWAGQLDRGRLRRALRMPHGAETAKTS